MEKKPKIPGPIPQKRRETVKMRRLKDGTIHDALFDAVVFARSQGYELVDPEDYKVQKKLRDGCHVAEGETIAPETAKGKRGSGPLKGSGQQESNETPGETRFIPFA